MATLELIIQMRFRWWLWPALWIYEHTCLLLDADQDYEMVEEAMWRACIVKMSGGAWRPLLEVLDDAKLL